MVRLVIWDAIEPIMTSLYGKYSVLLTLEVPVTNLPTTMLADAVALNGTNHQQIGCWLVS